MKALVYTEYGPPDVLGIREIERPSPTDSQVLVRVKASSINSWDWDLLIGTLQGRLGGLLKPQHNVLGADVSGLVEQVGSSVQEFESGDQVFGDVSGAGWGGFAEYVCVDQRALAAKPAGMTFEEAAATPQAGVLALQGLRHRGRVERGQRVLVNGAGGGVGTFAVQLAKMFGAEVTGVDRVEKLDAVRSIGADHVVDYTDENFTDGEETYDLVLDVLATRSTFAHRRSLTGDGRYVVVGGSTGVLLQSVLLGSMLNLGSTKKTGILAHKPNREDLGYLADLVSSGEIHPVIDSTYPLRESVEAFRRFGSGQHNGKIVITV